MKVLIVIDMQKGFVKNSKYQELNEKIKSYIRTHCYDKIIITKFVNDKAKNHLYQTKLNWCGLTTKEDQELSLNVSEDAVIIEKNGYGLNVKDIEYIKSLNIKEIDLCGIESSACVYAIALQLWDNEIYPNILIKYIDDNPKMQDIFIRQFGGVKE